MAARFTLRCVCARVGALLAALVVASLFPAPSTAAGTWLDEGFSDFLARYLMGVGANQCSSKNIDVSVFAFPAGLTSGGNWTECHGYFFTVFNKSTAMLNQVRAAMGTSDFFAALRAFIADHHLGIARSRPMLEHLEDWDSANLTPIFRAYTKRY